MEIVAKVSIKKSNFDEWLDFFNGYKDRRDEFIENEIVEKISENEAKVSFTIINLDGLTQLSSSEDITAREKELGIITEICTLNVSKNNIKAAKEINATIKILK